MYNLKLSHIKTIAYCWLALPVIIFIIGWLRPIISVPMALLVVFSMYIIAKRERSEEVIKIFFNRKNIIIFFIVFIWFLFSGIGGYTWQEPWDHSYRNAVFDALVTHDWPVTDYDNGEKVMLCYYFGYWLPAALVSKIFNSIAIGEFVQFIYGFTGIILCLLLIFNYLKGIKLRYVLTLILFGGANILLSFILNDMHTTFIGRPAMVYKYFCTSPISVQLYFIYNSAIPAMIVFTLLLTEKYKTGNLLFLLSLLTLFSPLMCVGLGFCILYLVVRDYKRSFTLQNVTGILFALVVILYFKSNPRVESAKIYDIHIHSMIMYLLFFFVEYILLYNIIRKRVKDSLLFNLTFYPLLILVWIRLGDTGDFGWRVTAPASFFLMIMLMQYITTLKLRRNLFSLLFTTYLAICSMPTIILIARHFTHTYINCTENKSMNANDINTIFDESPCHDNFIANNQNSIFIKYLIK